jgi:hypothetical protein
MKGVKKMLNLLAEATPIDLSAITTSLTQGLNSGVQTTIDCMAAIAPFGITIFVAVLAVRKAKAFFSTMTK